MKAKPHATVRCAFRYFWTTMEACVCVSWRIFRSLDKWWMWSASFIEVADDKKKNGANLILQAFVPYKSAVIYPRCNKTDISKSWILRGNLLLALSNASLPQFVMRVYGEFLKVRYEVIAGPAPWWFTTPLSSSLKATFSRKYFKG